MVKRLQIKQDEVKEWLEATYLMPIKVTPLNLGIIQNPTIFSKSVHHKAYKKGVARAKDDLQLLNFFLKNLRPKYRSQITNSQEFHNVIQSLVDIDDMKGQKMSKQEKESANALAIQLLSYALNVMLRTMPKEFLKPLKDHTLPLNNLLKAIYNFSKNNNLPELASFREIDFPITERD
ncbi:MAG: hypothetical protein ISR80_03520 [Nitrosopumilus sp.]|nr:hypothetical protein [Nitrosopumilus sp.]